MNNIYVMNNIYIKIKPNFISSQYYNISNAICST